MAQNCTRSLEALNLVKDDHKYIDQNTGHCLKCDDDWLSHKPAKTGNGVSEEKDDVFEIMNARRKYLQTKAQKCVGMIKIPGTDSFGSCTFIDRHDDDLYALTNLHVISEDRSVPLQVCFASLEAPAECVFSTKKFDFALVKLSATTLGVDDAGVDLKPLGLPPVAVSTGEAVATFGVGKVRTGGKYRGKHSDFASTDVVDAVVMSEGIVKCCEGPTTLYHVPTSALINGGHSGGPVFRVRDATFVGLNVCGQFDADTVESEFIEMKIIKLFIEELWAWGRCHVDPSMPYWI